MIWKTDDGGRICLGFPRCEVEKENPDTHSPRPVPAQVPGLRGRCACVAGPSGGECCPDARRQDGRPGSGRGLAPPPGHLSGLCRPRPSGPGLQTPDLARPLRSPRPFAPRSGPAPPGDHQRHCPPRRDVQAAALPPGASRPLTCGGRPAGRGRGGAGQQQGEPPGQPIPPRARAERTLRRRRRDGRAALAPAAPRAALCSLPRALLPPSFPPSRAPIPTCRPLPAPPPPSLSSPHLLRRVHAPRSWEGGMRGLAETLGDKFGERGGHGEQRDRKQSPAETDPKRDGKRSLRASRRKGGQKAPEARAQRTASDSFSLAPSQECI